LPGADDPAYVQTNPVWSPDGQSIVFARGKAYYLSKTVSPRAMPRTLNREFNRTGRPFQYDLYRIPYNQGRGGTPEPLRGASGNG
jgi:Tol biopolymer transport system component